MDVNLHEHICLISSATFLYFGSMTESWFSSQSYSKEWIFDNTFKFSKSVLLNLKTFSKLFWAWHGYKAWDSELPMDLLLSSIINVLKIHLQIHYTKVKQQTVSYKLAWKQYSKIRLSTAYKFIFTYLYVSRLSQFTKQLNSINLMGKQLKFISTIVPIVFSFIICITFSFIHVLIFFKKMESNKWLNNCINNAVQDDRIGCRNKPGDWLSRSSTLVPIIVPYHSIT